MGKLKEWNEYYNEWTVDDYNRHVQAVKGFCNRVMRFTPDRGRVLEVGTGSGQMSIYLSQHGYECDAIDQDKKVVENAEKLSKLVGGNFIHFFHSDLFKLDLDRYGGLYDTVFSQGLLEHFEDIEIKESFRIQKLLADVVAFSVPLDKFGHQSRGDERLMPKEH